MKFVKIEVLICLLCLLTSCDNERENSIEKKTKGKYLIEIYKYDSYSKFSMQSVVNGGSSNNVRFYNNFGEEFTKPYEVSDAVNKLSYEKFYTDDNATFLSFQLIALKVDDNLKDSMTIKAIGYFEEEKLFEVKHVFFSWNKEDEEKYKKFNVYSVNLSHYVYK